MTPRRGMHCRPAGSLLGACGFLFVVFVVPAAASAEEKRLTLEDALANARRNHPGLQASRAETTAAEAQVGEASSGYLPRVDTYVQVQRSTGNWAPSPGTAGMAQASASGRDNQLGLSDTVNYVTFGTVVTQPLYDFGKTGSKVDAAEAQDSLAQASLQANVQDVEVGVQVAYYQVLAAQQALLVAEEARQNQARHVEQVRQFVSAGSRTRYDLVSAELKREDADLTLVRAQNGLRTARVKLLNAMGQGGDTDVEVTEPVSEDSALEQQSPAELLRSAQAHRPELARSVAQIALRRADHRSATAGYLPDLVATGSFSGAKVADLATGLNWVVGVGLNWRVFEGLRTHRHAKATNALAVAAEAEHERLLQAVQTEILVQVLAIDEAKQRLNVSDRSVETAKERLRLAEGRYSAGAGSVLELEDAQVAYTSARFQGLQARYDLAVARVMLRRAVG